MLQDAYNRKIDYLRISVTDRCNLRCVYCMPETGIVTKPHGEILSFEEIYAIVNTAAGLGIRKVRVTGGEPLVRKDLVLLIKKLKEIKGLKEICLTTNGTYLSEHALSLKQVGLDRINISLDSLVKEKFKRITRGGDLEEVFRGIEAALSAGFNPLKINVVLMKGFNDDEVPDFINLAKTRPLHIRFIEYMPTFSPSLRAPTLTLNEVKRKGRGEAISDEIASVASRKRDPVYWTLPRNDGVAHDLFFSCQTAKKILSGMKNQKDFTGQVEFISPLSEPFCSSCNKLRLTSDGWLRSCLHSSRGVNLKDAVRNGVPKDVLAGLIMKAAALKPKSHNLSVVPANIDAENFSMCQIGG